MIGAEQTESGFIPQLSLGDTDFIFESVFPNREEAMFEAKRRLGVFLLSLLETMDYETWEQFVKGVICDHYSLLQQLKS